MTPATALGASQANNAADRCDDNPGDVGRGHDTSRRRLRGFPIPWPTSLKYPMAMPCENAVVQAPAPDRPIDGGMATEALLAQVLIGKYWRTERRLSVKQRFCNGPS
jgi:transposase